MNRPSALSLTAAFATLALSACTSPATGEDTAAESGDQPSGLEAVTVESITPGREAPAEDQFISCVEDKGNGIKTTQFFPIQNGMVKSYSQMQNRARPMCDAGQPGCALGWQGEKIGLYFETASGAVNQMLLDLETLTLQKRLTTASSGVEESAAQCTSGPFPEGVVID